MKEGGENVSEGKFLVKDVIEDAFLQQILTRTADYDEVATMNLNGDYILYVPGANEHGITVAISKKTVTYDFARHSEIL